MVFMQMLLATSGRDVVTVCMCGIVKANYSVKFSLEKPATISPSVLMACCGYSAIRDFGRSQACATKDEKFVKTGEV